MPSQPSVPTNFNFLNEVGKEGNYLLLYPPPQAGLAILSLYQKVKTGVFLNGRFKEADIYSAFEAYKILIGEEEYERLPHIKFNNMISDLQVYFLRYDSEDQLYTFKDYGESFCRHAEEILMANFNPTQIEIICNNLRDGLANCKSNEELISWIDTYFNNFKPVMKLQVDQLERQVDQSVQEIRATTQIGNKSIIDVLKDIDLKLDLIRDQNTELRSAFREMKSINLLLDVYLNGIEDRMLFEKISMVKQFFPEVKYTLRLIDKRLDRIQPKLRQFFGMLNKPTFSVRIEKFLKYLFKHSTAENGKPIQLPAGIPIHGLWRETIDFPIVERKEDLFPAISKPRQVYVTDVEDQEKGTASAKQYLKNLDETQRYLDLILKEVSVSPVLFSTWFFKIVEDKHGQIELATNVAYALIRHVERSNYLDITTANIKSHHSEYPNLSLWEMTIQQKVR